MIVWAVPGCFELLLWIRSCFCGFGATQPEFGQYNMRGDIMDHSILCQGRYMPKKVVQVQKQGSNCFFQISDLDLVCFRCTNIYIVN